MQDFKKNLESYLDLEKKIFDFFGFKPNQYVSLPPIRDFSEMYWRVAGNLTENLQDGDVIYFFDKKKKATSVNNSVDEAMIDSPYSQNENDKIIFCTENYTMIFLSFAIADSKIKNENTWDTVEYLGILSNDKRVKESEIPALKVLNHKSKQIDAMQLRKIIEENPNAKLHELAEQFDCSTPHISAYIRKHGIPYEKKKTGRVPRHQDIES